MPYNKGKCSHSVLSCVAPVVQLLSEIASATAARAMLRGGGRQPKHWLRLKRGSFMGSSRDGERLISVAFLGPRLISASYRPSCELGYMVNLGQSRVWRMRISNRARDLCETGRASVAVIQMLCAATANWLLSFVLQLWLSVSKCLLFDVVWLYKDDVLVRRKTSLDGRHWLTYHQILLQQWIFTLRVHCD
jgi:hypothetical protein